MGAHVTDLDDLLGRPPAAAKSNEVVQWPPPPSDLDLDPEHRESDIGQVVLLQEEEERQRMQQQQQHQKTSSSVTSGSRAQFLTPQNSLLSDDEEGSYQALSVVFAGTSKEFNFHFSYY